jgi:hypothetical protein
LNSTTCGRVARIDLPAFPVTIRKKRRVTRKTSVKAVP